MYYFIKCLMHTGSPLLMTGRFQSYDRPIQKALTTQFLSSVSQAHPLVTAFWVLSNQPSFIAVCSVQSPVITIYVFSENWLLLPIFSKNTP